MRVNPVAEGDWITPGMEECTGMDGALPTRVPAERMSVEPEQASPARIYDWLLGGSHNFATDRAFAERVIAQLRDRP